MAQISYKTHHDLIKDRATRFEDLLRRGAFAPLLFQYAIGTSLLLLLPLVIRHRTVSQSIMLRYGFHAVITVFCAHTIIQVRLLGPGNGYGVGLITTWFYIWSTTILLANDVQKDFRRIIKEPEIALGTGKASLDLLQRQKLPKRYNWQPFPHKLSDRLDWTLDLIFNFRGPNWNWRLKSLPPLPEAVINDLNEMHNFRSTTRQLQQMDVDKLASMKLRKVLIHFARDYMILDLLKITLMRDPYFWGYVDKPLPTPPWPFVILAGYPVLIRSYRIVLSLLSVLYALKAIIALNPLFFMGLSYNFPRLARAVSRQPLGEAWLYPDAFGPATSIFDHGLVGAWNIWWHHLFRFGFSECSRFLTDLILPDNALEKKEKHSFKQARLALQVMLAFSLSGLIHALGSYTTFSNARPWDSFLFFFLQGLGTIAQYIFQSTVVPAIFPRKKSTTSSPPRWLIRLANFVVIVLWFYFTGPLIADDFARAGIWTFEPIPLSLLRGGLGMGVEGDGWWCWKGPWFKWHEGDTWWRSGIRIV